ncbi:MAG: PG0541 family transporter-associated protein [Kiritimatiellia bacterium]
MKMVMIVYNEAIDEEVFDALRQCCDLVAYTKWTKVCGQGCRSEPHLQTHVWPKGNNVLMVCTEEITARKLVARVRELRATFGREGLKAFVWTVDEVT